MELVSGVSMFVTTVTCDTATGMFDLYRDDDQLELWDLI